MLARAAGRPNQRIVPGRNLIALSCLSRTDRASSLVSVKWKTNSIGKGYPGMFDYNGSFQSAIAALKRERRYRTFADLERKAGQFPQALWNGPGGARNVVVWCSNNYLGMGQHPKVIEAMCTASRTMGAGAGR